MKRLTLLCGILVASISWSACKTKDKKAAEDACKSIPGLAVAKLGVKNKRIGQNYTLSNPQAICVLHEDMEVGAWFGWSDPAVEASINGDISITHKGVTSQNMFLLKAPKPGIYQFDIGISNCKTGVFSNGNQYDCDCKIKSNPMTAELEVVDTTILRISKLTFMPASLKCAHDVPADPCPDLQPVFRTGYNGKVMSILWNYDRGLNKPAVWEEKFDMAISEKYQDITLEFQEYDTFGDDDVLFKYKITSDMVKGWTAGTYSLFGGILELVIE